MRATAFGSSPRQISDFLIARTNLIRASGSEYLKVICLPIKNADEWIGEIYEERHFAPDHLNRQSTPCNWRLITQH
jgi:hypothetical protein